MTSRYPCFPGQISSLKSLSPYWFVIRKIPCIHTLLWTVPSLSSSERNLASPWGHWIPCSPHEWWPALSHLSCTTGSEGNPGACLTPRGHFQATVSFLPSPISCFEADAIRLHLQTFLLCLLLSSLSLPHIPWRFQHQVYCVSLLQSPVIIFGDFNVYMAGPSNLLASLFLKPFASSDLFFCHFSHQPPLLSLVLIIYNNCIPSIISVSSILLLHPAHARSSKNSSTPPGTLFIWPYCLFTVYFHPPGPHSLLT